MTGKEVQYNLYFCVYGTNRRGDFMIENNLMDDNYISIDDAAAYLGIKTVTLRNWIKKKPDIPAHRVGKLWKFKRSELDEWIASGKSAE